MRDITGKQISLRTAKGMGAVLCAKEIVELIKNDKLPKGNLLMLPEQPLFLLQKYPEPHPALSPGFH